LTGYFSLYPLLTLVFTADIQSLPLKSDYKKPRSVRRRLFIRQKNGRKILKKNEITGYSGPPFAGCGFLLYITKTYD
jgi:hypothetical protein